MTASTNVDSPEVAATAIVTTGVRSLSSDPRIDGIRKATRPERRAITDAHQMEGAHFVLSRRLAVRVFWRLAQVQLLGANVDQDILAWMTALQVGTMPLVHLAAGPGDVPMMETHCGHRITTPKR